MRNAPHWFSAVLFAVVFLNVPPLAQAQAPLGMQSLFLESRLGVAHYAGENGASPLFAECPAGVDGCRAAAYGAALEAGVRWSPSFSTSLSYQAANYPSIGASDVVPPLYASAYRTRTTVQVLGQYHFAEWAPWTTPYLQAGLHVTTGRTPLPDDRLQTTGQLLVGQRWTVGPSVGAGLSFPVSRHVAVFAEATISLATPDKALDGSGGFWGVDRLGWAGVGLRINSSALPQADVATGSTVPMAVDAVAPRELTVDEMGRFQVRTAEGLPEDHQLQWVFSDGTVREGRVVTKQFSTAGTYRATLRHPDDGAPLQTFRVRVQPAPPPLRIAAIRVQPESPRAGQPVAFKPVFQSGTPVDYEWGLGNGTKAFTRTPVHTYPAPGSYDVTLQVSGPAGQATYARQVTVVVPEPVQPRIERAPVVIRVQLGAFSTAARAEQFADRHADRLPKAPDVQEDPPTGLYRVTLPYSDEGTARDALRRLRQTASFSGAFLKRTN
jgi:hypothetical protein